MLVDPLARNNNSNPDRNVGLEALQDIPLLRPSFHFPCGLHTIFQVTQ